ncbi:hypothetical protein [Paracoccus methylarcula]|nr:hypothetical protein [Paracoccus methylarcula]
MKFSIYHAQPVLDLIGKYESRGDYDIVYGGIPKSLRPKVKITSLTVRGVLTWQANIRAHGVASTAAGKYQIIYNTLKATVAQMGFNTSRVFDETVQDEMACHLLIGRGFQRYLDGAIDMESMVIGLAKEWASLPVPRDMQGPSRWLKAGQSYYAGDGLNKAHASVAEVETALAIARERYRSGAQPSAPAPDPAPAPSPAKPSSSNLLTTALIIGAAAAIIFLKG